MEELAIIKRESVAEIATLAPQAYTENGDSRDKCLAFGKNILSQIKENGMTDDLDQRAAVFIERARKTLTKMKTKRSPVTKLFDEVRRAFTLMENEVDPSANGTVANELQLLRNQYAAKKREEEERKRQELVARQQKQASIDRYKLDCETDYKKQFTAILNNNINQMFKVREELTLENYVTSYTSLQNEPIELPEDFVISSNAYRPLNLTPDESKAIQTEVWQNLREEFHRTYKEQIALNKGEVLDSLPSKKIELEKIAQADAAKQAKLKEEMAAKEAAQAAEREKERIKQEEANAKNAEMKQSTSNINDLFGQMAVSNPTYQPKTSVKLVMKPLAVEAFPEIIGLWWQNEGCRLSVEDLAKTFKKQVTYCEKLANDKTNPIRIHSEFVEYVEDVKAK